jgi:CheY-like chemotaxis protein
VTDAISTGDSLVTTTAHVILMADDEELMREVLSIMIEEHGCEVIVAVDGQHAVDLFEQHKGRVDGVILDFSMPRLNGLEAYKQIRAKSDSVPVMIMSGLKIVPEVEVLTANQQIEFIGKPFRESDFVAALQRSLQGLPKGRL